MTALLISIVLAVPLRADLSIRLSPVWTSTSPSSIKHGSKFTVALRNSGKSTFKVLSEACNWGYESLSFEATNSVGGKYTISRVPRGWDKNSPTGPDLFPGKSLTCVIDFTDATWIGFPSATRAPLRDWRIRAVVAVKPESILTERNFWVGRAASSWVAFRL